MGSFPAAYRMIRRRAKAAGIKTRIGNHTLRATGITTYLRNDGRLEHAQTMANHFSPRTTKLYDRREEEISLDVVERIVIQAEVNRETVRSKWSCRELSLMDSCPNRIRSSPSVSSSNWRYG